jgi:hypothetical protein
MVRVLFYVCLLAGGLYLGYRFRKQLAGFWLQLAKEWREFLDWLFGRRPHPESQQQAQSTVTEVKPVWRFADYPDPFMAGAAPARSAADLLRYTFQAFEAWARDHGIGRAEDQTPQEFARRVSRHAAEVGAAAGPVVELYCQLAYANTPPGEDARDLLIGLWRRMCAVPPAPARRSVDQPAV